MKQFLRLKFKGIFVLCVQEKSSNEAWEKKGSRVFCVYYVFKRNQMLKLMKDFLFLCSYVFKVKKNLSVKARESKRKI